MKVINLSERNQVYSCNVYLLLGDWNTLDDVNTLIDVGRDAVILDTLLTVSTGVGKRRAEQVLITHGHYDHVSLLPQIKTLYNPIVRAGALFTPEVDCLLKDGQIIKAGDQDLEVLYTPGHSNDSFCFYCRSEKIIFTGDTNLLVRSSEGSYSEAYIEALERLNRLDIEVIYPGHGPAIKEHCGKLIRHSLRNLGH